VKRRQLLTTAVAALAGPSLLSLLGACAPAAPAAPTTTARPAAASARSGGGGPLSLLWWQAPTILNAHLSLATKDVGAVRIYAEPLADFNARNELVPILAADIPSQANGGLTPDGSSVVWRLKQGVTWHDGQPFTAADVAFTYRYLSDPATSATTLGYYADVAAVETDLHTGVGGVVPEEVAYGRGGEAPS